MRVCAEEVAGIPEGPWSRVHRLWGLAKLCSCYEGGSECSIDQLSSLAEKLNLA